MVCENAFRFGVQQEGDHPPEAVGPIAGIASALIVRFSLIEATHQLTQGKPPCSWG